MQEQKTLQGLPGGTPMPEAGQPAEAISETPIPEAPKPKERAPQAFETTGSYVVNLSEPIIKGEDTIKELIFGRLTMKELLIFDDFQGRIEVEESAVSQQKLAIDLIQDVCSSMTGLSDELILQLDPVDWLKIQFHIKFKMQKKREEMNAATQEMGIDLEEVLAA